MLGSRSSRSTASPKRADRLRHRARRRHHPRRFHRQSVLHSDVRLVDLDGNDVVSTAPASARRFVVAGYRNRPADIAVRDAGFIFIGDRIKDMIMIRVSVRSTSGRIRALPACGRET